MTAGNDNAPPAGTPSGEHAISLRIIWLDLLVYPTYTLPIAVAPVLAGIGLAIHDGVFNLWPALAGFAVSWLIHIGGVMLDNHELLVRHPDVIEHPELTTALADGTLSLNVLRGAIALCFLVPALSGPYFLHVSGTPAILFGLLGFVSAWGYAGRPLVYARHIAADIIFFLMFGVVAVAGTYYVQAAALHGHYWHTLLTLPASAYFVGLPIGALITNMMLIDHLRDRAPDRRKGWNTSAVRFGPTFGRVEITTLTALTYLAPFWFWLGLGFSPWVLLTLLTLPRAITMTRIVCSEARFRDLFPLAPKVAALCFYYSALLAIGLSVGSTR
jgi:1,4-dihydroxy-2-naphthoate polyprenyltransferase